jgi:NAD(P)H-flavin reductase
MQEDIIMYNELEKLKEKLKIDIRYFIDQGESDKPNICQGLISEEVIGNLISENKNRLFMLCGSKVMTGFYLRPILKKFGVEDENVIVF